MNSIAHVVAKWRAEGVDLLPPLEELQLIATVGSLGQTVSRDVAELYRATSGMSDGDMDSLCFSLWPPERLARENQKHSVDGVLFADFLIDSHLYLFRYEDSDRSSVHVEHFDGKGPQRVADSITEFFELYLETPEKVYLYDLDRADRQFGRNL